MKVLALDTSTFAGSIAIVDDIRGLAGEVKVNVKVAYAERLMPSIEWLLGATGIELEEIDLFAISIGPGSFTGLRIGLSTAKGFAFATNKPLVPVSTLDAFARTLPFCSQLICPMMDARKKQVYAGLYRWDNGTCIKAMPEIAVIPDMLLEKISEPTLFTGDGAIVYRDVILKSLGDDAFFAPHSHMHPTAATVAEIAFEKVRAGETFDPEGLTPFYIRKSEAELKWRG